MPEGSQETSVLALHCGRVLLGFTSEPDRKAYLSSAPKDPSDAERVARFEAFLERHRDSSKDDEDPLDVLGPAGKHLEDYVAAALRLGRQAQVVSALGVLESRWENNTGRAKIAEAAFRAGELGLAERKIRDLIAQYPDAHRSETMGTLARILDRTERRDEAWWVLTESLRKLATEAKKATGSDVRLFATWKEDRARVLRELFPERAEAYLANPET